MEDYRKSRAGVLKVVDIDPQGSMRPSKGSMTSQGVKRGSMNNQGVIECLLGVEGTIQVYNFNFSIRISKTEEYQILLDFFL